MLNNAFVAEQAKHFAKRVEGMAGLKGEEAVRTAFRLALARPPSAAENEICVKLLDNEAAAYRETGRSPDDSDRQALVHMCHTLLNTSEFLYLE